MGEDTPGENTPYEKISANSALSAVNQRPPEQLRIRQAIRRVEYDLTAHAVEEMAEDDLDIVDVEAAILTGDVTKMQKDDPRGSRHTIVGPSADGERLVGVVDRFTENGIFLVITVYAVTEPEG